MSGMTIRTRRPAQHDHIDHTMPRDDVADEALMAAVARGSSKASSSEAP